MCAKGVFSSKNVCQSLNLNDSYKSTMPYVSRDTIGQITAVLRDPTPDAPEFLAHDDPALIAFILGEGATDPLRQALQAMDLQMVRVLEDLIDVLLRKHVIQVSDLPPEAQRKLDSRQGLRGELQGQTGLLGGDDLL